MITEGGVNLWRQSDAARWLGVSRQRVRVLIRRGELSTLAVRSVLYVEHRSLMAYGRSVKQMSLDADLLSAGRRVRL